MTVEDVESSSRRWRILFEERHGAGAYERLLAELGQPCVTFAAIAKRLGVTRERVRQWQLALLPDAPRGHERQRQCARWRHKRRLFADPLFTRSSTGVHPTQRAQVVHKDLLVSLETIEAILDKRKQELPSAGQKH